MAQNREANSKGAMADLVAILEARRTDYARAEAALDTAGDAVEQSFTKLLRIATGLIGPQAGALS
jgi:XRE family transcriptional regulator, aerobic/anaerobic benzoate catabolism transcriptional regulator